MAAEGAISFRAVLGAGEDEPLCYLLELDGFKILLDCGWDYNFDVALLAPLAQIVNQIDIILLSHPDIYHLGALPYLVGQLHYTGKIYATEAVWRMGQAFMRDVHQVCGGVYSCVGGSQSDGSGQIKP
jgi:cleavage and polyadenylation specificity factor subunit 2